MDEDEQHQKEMQNIESQQSPTLRFMDQTPNPSPRRPQNKRTRSEVSPLSEEVIEDNVTSRLDEIVESTLIELVPKKNPESQVKSSLQQLIKPLIHEELETYKKKILMDVQSEIKNSRQNEHLKMLSETESLKNYNRRENVRIIGLQEKTSTDENNRTTHESVDE